MIIFVVVILVSQPIKSFKVNIFITNDLSPDYWIFQTLILHEIDNGVNGFFGTEGLSQIPGFKQMFIE